MDEHIVPAGALDETLALRGVKPLYCAFFLHLHFLLIQCFVVLLGLKQGKRTFEAC